MHVCFLCCNIYICVLYNKYKVFNKKNQKKINAYIYNLILIYRFDIRAYVFVNIMSSTSNTTEVNSCLYASFKSRVPYISPTSSLKMS